MEPNLDKAIAYAKEVHKDQKYGDGKDFFYHLQKTYEVAVRFELSDEIKEACFLHDTLEDTMVTHEDLWDGFSWYTAHLVELVTDEPGENRGERKIKTYRKTRMELDAILLKLCDRIANVEACLEFGQYGLLKMYQKEQAMFQQELMVQYSEKVTKMFNHLNKLLDQTT